MTEKIVLLTESELKNLLLETIEIFYEKIYKNRNGNALLPLQEEIIDRKELRRRLNITEPTVMRWEKRKKIPVIRIGSSVRYNWSAVVKSLE